MTSCCIRAFCNFSPFAALVKVLLPWEELSSRNVMESPWPWRSEPSLSLAAWSWGEHRGVFMLGPISSFEKFPPFSLVQCFDVQLWLFWIWSYAAHSDVPQNSYQKEAWFISGLSWGYCAHLTSSSSPLARDFQQIPTCDDTMPHLSNPWSIIKPMPSSLLLYPLWKWGNWRSWIDHTATENWHWIQNKEVCSTAHTFLYGAF